MKRIKYTFNEINHEKIDVLATGLVWGYVLAILSDNAINNIINHMLFNYMERN
jgi:hypothetical protein